jgi:hypothetical protein
VVSQDSTGNGPDADLMWARDGNQGKTPRTGPSPSAMWRSLTGEPLAHNELGAGSNPAVTTRTPRSAEAAVVEGPGNDGLIAVGEWGVGVLSFPHSSTAEQLAVNEKVLGSNPSVGALSDPEEVEGPVCEAGASGFKSRRSPQCRLGELADPPDSESGFSRFESWVGSEHADEGSNPSAPPRWRRSSEERARASRRCGFESRRFPNGGRSVIGSAPVFVARSSCGRDAWVRTQERPVRPRT